LLVEEEAPFLNTYMYGETDCAGEGQSLTVLYCRWFRQDHHQLRALAEADDRIYRAGECLIIQHAVESDAGRWVCVANNTAGVERMDVVLHVTSPLNVVIQPSGQLTVDVGGKATFTCHVSGSSPHLPATRTWLKDGHVIGPGGETLVLDKVQREDAGMYQCLVRSEDDSAQSSVQLRLGGESLLKSVVTHYTLFMHSSYKSYPCNGPWRPISLRDVEAPTFSRQSPHRWR
jgi:hypothetical protein